MPAFRKKPVLVEAERVRDLCRLYSECSGKLPGWIMDGYDKQGRAVIFFRDWICIRTPEGEMAAEPNDWIICGVKGELYPCKPDVFDATYEEVGREE